MAAGRKIVLKHGSWLYSPSKPIAVGSFGRVFSGKSPDGRVVAIKQLDATGLGLEQREMRIADELVGRAYSHVIPILDYGIDAKTGGYFIVMPRAEMDLEAYVKANGAQSAAAAVRIVEQIALGLSEIALVHRDLKPKNVLLQGAAWKIADFGIARFVEEQTSAHTLKQHLSPGYAAPEQWRLEKATRATDVYALGCIAHFLLTGAPPFGGPDRDDFSRQHLEEPPPVLPVDPGLRQLIALCLSKPAAGRPDIASVLRTIAALKRTDGNAPSPKLLQIGAVDAQERTEEQAREAARARAQRERKELIAEGRRRLVQSIDLLVSSIREATPTSQYFPDISELRLRNGCLFWRGVAPFEQEVFARSGKKIACGAIIGAVQGEKGSFPGQSANLWFADWEGDGSYRWWEVAYISLTGQPRVSPFGVEHADDLVRVDQAHGAVLGVFQVSGQPTPIEGEHQQSFILRWQERLAEAATRPLGPIPQRW